MSFKQRTIPGWPQTWKTWKTQAIWKIVRILGKTQEKLNFCRKTWKTQGKCNICNIIANENVFQGIFLSWVAQRKILKMLWKSQGNSGNLVSQKCGDPEYILTEQMVSHDLLRLTVTNQIAFDQRGSNMVPKFECSMDCCQALVSKLETLGTVYYFHLTEQKLSHLYIWNDAMTCIKVKKNMLTIFFL